MALSADFVELMAQELGWKERSRLHREALRDFLFAVSWYPEKLEQFVELSRQRPRREIVSL